MKKILISFVILGLALVISAPQGASAQSIVKTNLQYVVKKTPNDPLVTSTFTPWGLPTVILKIVSAYPGLLPANTNSPGPGPVQLISKKKPKQLTM